VKKRCPTCGSESVWFTRLTPVKSYPPHGNGCPNEYHVSPEQKEAKPDGR